MGAWPCRIHTMGRTCEFLFEKNIYGSNMQTTTATPSPGAATARSPLPFPQHPHHPVRVTTPERTAANNAKSKSTPSTPSPFPPPTKPSSPRPVRTGRFTFGTRSARAACVRSLVWGDRLPRVRSRPRRRCLRMRWGMIGRGVIRGRRRTRWRVRLWCMLWGRERWACDVGVVLEGGGASTGLKERGKTQVEPRMAGL